MQTIDAGGLTTMIQNLLTNPPQLPMVAPSILSADFGRMAAECKTVLEGGADLLHVDVMDGSFAPNLTMGPDMCRGIRSHLPDAFLDVHLMVDEPGLFVKAFADAGANHFTFHIEAALDGPKPFDPLELAKVIRSHGMSAGLAINPPTAIEDLLPYIEAFELVLVMSVNPGYSGQAFIPEVLEKVRILRAKLNAAQRVQMDGGVNMSSAGRCIEAGCDVLAAASAIFGADDYCNAIAELRACEA